MDKLITQAMVDQLKADIDTWYDDFLTDEDNECNEWYLQFVAVLDAAYGKGNWEL
jgi:hypothetical protein